MSTFYAVKKGINEGIYETWEECRAQIDSFSGSQYKKFKTKEEAQEYMENGIKYKIQELSIHELDKIVYEYGFYQALKLWESKKGPITNLPIDEERKFLGALVYSIVITDFCSVREWEFDTDEDEES